MDFIDKLFGKKKSNVEEAQTESEEAYNRDCLTPKFIEEEETKTWEKVPECRHVLALLNNRDYVAVCREAEKLVSNFGDFAAPYRWWAEAFIEMGSYDEARHVLLQGLKTSKEKWLLLDSLGKVAWKSGDLKDAVYWWAQGMHCQESLEERNYGGGVETYLHLHYVADGVGLSDCASVFLLRVDEIRPEKIRLISQEAEELRSLARSGKTSGIERVLKELVNTYIIPARLSVKSVDTEEVNRLIRILEQALEQGEKSRDYEKAKKADEEALEVIKKLGEIGNPRAIPALTRARNQISIGLSTAGEEAIKKIKGKQK